MTSPVSPPGAKASSVRARRRSLIRRIHFRAALIASPFALLAVLTGILYIFTPQVEAILHGHLDRIVPGTVRLPLDNSVEAARREAPAGWRLHSVAPAYAATDTVKAIFIPPVTAHAGHAAHQHGHMPVTPTPQPGFGVPANAQVIYVNPYTAQVAGSLANRDRFGTWAKRLHSRLLQSDNWRWMIELAASWMMVMLLTGSYLWWPRQGRHVLPKPAAKGRMAWKRWHGLLGVALAAISLVMLSTGLTWSKYAGRQVRLLRDAMHQAPPRVPLHLRSTLQEGVAPMTWQAAWDTARRNAPAIPLLLMPPPHDTGTWLVRGNDASQPEKNFDMVLDAYSGQVLYYAGWNGQTLFSKATAIGIPFHRGEFGWWNQALLLMFGAGVLFSLVSGWTMYFKRRQPGSSGLPPLLPGAWKSASPAMRLIAVLLCLAMPVLAVSAVIVVLLEIRQSGSSRRQARTAV